MSSDRLFFDIICSYLAYSFHFSYTQNGDNVQFKVKKDTKFKKIFKAYAASKGIDVSSLRFLLDGDAIGADQTPKMLEMEDGDQIDCMLEQTGGASVGYGRLE